MCFHRNINGNRDVKFLECDYLLAQRCVKLTLKISCYGRKNMKEIVWLSAIFSVKWMMIKINLLFECGQESAKCFHRVLNHSQAGLMLLSSIPTKNINLIISKDVFSFDFRVVGYMT